MRKRLIAHERHTDPPSGGRWLDLNMVRAEISSEDPAHPIECALLDSAVEGWRAAQPGTQVLRIRFDQPQELHRIRIVFAEGGVERTHEFVLRWQPYGGDTFYEIVRQQWNFSSTSALETEDYAVELVGVGAVELAMNPNIRNRDAYASLQALRMA